MLVTIYANSRFHISTKNGIFQEISYLCKQFAKMMVILMYFEHIWQVNKFAHILFIGLLIGIPSWLKPGVSLVGRF